MYQKIRQISRYLSSFDLSTYAASASFFIILSIFPLLTLVLSLLRFLPLTLQDLMNVMSNVLPEIVVKVAGYLMNDLYTSNVLTVVSVTVLVALWSASRGVFGIINGINTILGSDENRSYLRRRLTAIFYTFLLILALFLTLGLQVFGKSILSMIADWDLRLFSMVSKLVQLRFVFTTGILSLLFMMIFAVFPAKRMHLRNVVPAAVLTAVGWLVFSYLFSIYVDYGGGSRFYGSMAMLVLSLLWLYICMCILFFGGVLCKLSEEGKLNLKTARLFFQSGKKS